MFRILSKYILIDAIIFSSSNCQLISIHKNFKLIFVIVDLALSIEKLRGRQNKS